MVNRVWPELEAVKMLPVPELLFTTSEANAVDPEREATGYERDVPWTSRVANGVELPTPSLLLELLKYKLESEMMSWLASKKAIWVAIPVPVIPDPAPAQLPELKQKSTDDWLRS